MWIQLLASISIGAFIIMAWNLEQNLKRRLNRTETLWMRAVIPAAFVVVAVCGSVVSPPDGVNDEIIVDTFYLGAVVMLIGVTWLLQKSGAVRSVLVMMASVLAYLIVDTDLIIAGATKHNGLITRLPGQYYAAFLVFTIVCLLAQFRGEYTLHQSINDPRERNRFRINAAGIAVPQFISIVLVVAMLLPLPPVSAPMLLPGALAVAASVYIFSSALISLPLFAPVGSADHRLHLQCAEILNDYMGLGLCVSYDELIKMLEADQRVLALDWPARKAFNSVSPTGPVPSPVLSKLGWNRELESLAAVIASMQPVEEISPLITFDGSKITGKHYFLYQSEQKP